MATHNTTIKDIAQKLGLSTSTVSRAMNDRWEVKKETRELVLKTAEEMDYHSNPQAVFLATKRSNTIGLVVPELVNSFFSIISSGVQNILKEAGYCLLIMQSNESPEEESENILLLQHYNVDGIILSTTPNCEYNRTLYQKLIDDGLPLIFFNRVCNSIRAPKIIIDNMTLSYRVVNHLLKQGCKKIIHLAGPEGLTITDERKNGYLRALGEFNIPIDKSLIFPTGIFQNDGESAINRILDSGVRPDAIFSFNDPVAIGAMKALKKRGLKIPQDVAVAGFSESRSALIIEPNLTTVAQPLTEMGETAARLLLNKLQGKDIGTPTVVLDAKINIRESSLKNN